MRATLLESLSSDSNHELKDALHYYSNGQDYTFSVGDAIPIMDKKTTDSQPIDISSNWKGVEERTCIRCESWSHREIFYFNTMGHWKMFQEMDRGLK